MIQNIKYLFYLSLSSFLIISCYPSKENISTQISEETKKEAITFLEKFAKIRTSIPADPKAYLNLFAKDERFVIGGDNGFVSDYQVFYDKLINDKQKLNPDWVTRFDFKFRELKISQIDPKNLLFTTYFDEFIVAKSGDTLRLKNNVIHGSLIEIDGEWKILTVLYSHNAENERMDADFDARNQK